MPLICRHNRFTAECPICSKGTVLDPNRAQGGPRSTRSSATKRAGARRGSAAAGATVSRGVFAAAGPYEEGREVRLERVPGGLRLASWHAGQLVRDAPVMTLGDIPRLLAEAEEKEVLEPLSLELGGAPGAAGHGASPGRTGELRDELRVERLDPERVRIARWVLRPNRGWELQAAPVLLPPARFAAALEAAAALGVLSSEARN